MTGCSGGALGHRGRPRGALSSYLRHCSLFANPTFLAKIHCVTFAPCRRNRPLFSQAPSGAGRGPLQFLQSHPSHARAVLWEEELKMANQDTLRRAVRYALFANAAVAGAIPAAYSQTQPPAQAQPPAAEAAVPLQEVIITGSRISAPGLTSVSPVTTITPEEVKE